MAPNYQAVENITHAKRGAMILGIGGDNSDKGIGTFFEGAITLKDLLQMLQTLLYKPILSRSNMG